MVIVKEQGSDLVLVLMLVRASVIVKEQGSDLA